MAIAISLACCIQSASAYPARFTLPVTHVPSAIYSATLKGAHDPNRQMALTLVLPLRNEDDLERAIRHLYNPANPGGSKFLTQPEFADKYGPSVADAASVCAFVTANGLTVSNVSASRTNIQIVGSVAKIESAFSIKTSDLYSRRI